MKSLNILILVAIAAFLFLLPNKISAQVNGINYQAVAVDENGVEIAGMDIQGNIIHNKAINVRFTILSGSATGPVLYQETHTTNTDPHGLFSLVIGLGTPTNAGTAQNLLQIDWSTTNQWLKVEVDYKQSNGYKLMGVQQLLAVPYAFYALNAKNVQGSFDKDSTNELQNLSITGDQLSLSKGNSVTLPATTFNAGTGINITGNTITNTLPNQVQILSLSHDTIFLSNGGFVKLPAGFSGNYNDLTGKPNLANVATTGNYNDLSNTPNLSNFLTSEVQILSISNDTVYLTGGSFVKLPQGFSGNYNDLTNKPNLANVATTGNYSDLNNTPDLSNFLTSEIQILSISNDTVYLTGGSFVKLPAGFSGNYNDLSNLPALFDGTWNSLAGKPVLFDGNYNSLTNKPVLFSGAYADLTGKPSLWDSTWASIKNKPAFFDGNYNNLLNLPTLFDGNYNNLSNKPVLFSGAYADLTGKPILWDSTWASIKNKPAFFDGAYSSLAGIPSFAIVATSGSYTDLSNLPTLFDGNYNNLSNLPVLFDGNYNSLSNKPTLFSGAYSDLTGKPTLWDSTWASIKNKPAFFSGNYNDLINLPALFDGAWSSLSGVPTTLLDYGITDAMSTSHVANDITNTNISNWNNAFGWGNHATAGYLTSFNEQDTIIWKKNGLNLYLGWGNAVGFGTNLPEAFVHFNNPIGGCNVLIKGEAGASTTRAELILDRTSSGRGGGIRIKDSQTNVSQWWVGVPYNGGGSSDFFTIGRHTTTPEHRDNSLFRINNNGNVGIGTNISANSKLEVAGMIHSTSEGYKFPDGTIQTTAATSGSGSSGFQVFSSSGTFIVPAGVTQIIVEAWGAGGGGSAWMSVGEGGRGGGGGGYGKDFLSVTSGQTYTVTVGTGGAGGVGFMSNGANGGSSSFQSLISASGGEGGKFWAVPGGSSSALINQNGNSSSLNSGATGGAGGQVGGPCGSTFGKGGNGGNENQNGLSGQNGLVIIQW